MLPATPYHRKATLTCETLQGTAQATHQNLLPRAAQSRSLAKFKVIQVARAHSTSPFVVVRESSNLRLKALLGLCTRQGASSMSWGFSKEKCLGLECAGGVPMADHIHSNQSRSNCSACCLQRPPATVNSRGSMTALLKCVPALMCSLHAILTSVIHQCRCIHSGPTQSVMPTKQPASAGEGRECLKLFRVRHRIDRCLH